MILTQSLGQTGFWLKKRTKRVNLQSLKKFLFLRLLSQIDRIKLNLIRYLRHFFFKSKKKFYQKILRSDHNMHNTWYIERKIDFCLKEYKNL